MKKLVLFGALILALSGCASMDNGSAKSDMSSGDAAAAKAAIAAAEASLKKAKDAHGEWRDTDKKMLHKAKDAASKGDYATALKLANKAKFEGDMGYQQAMDQKNIKPWLF